MTRILLALLAVYRRILSPALHAISPGGCKFVPTCSAYAEVAIATHGAMRGSALAAWRLLRCHPFTRGGFDPVPAVKNGGIAAPAITAPNARTAATSLPPDQLT